MAKCLTERSRTIKILAAEEILINNKALDDVLLAKKLLPYTHSPELIKSCPLTPSSDRTPIKIRLKRFTLRDIADVMRKKGWMRAAKLQDDWFDKPYFSAEDEHQKGKKLYGEANVDTDTIKMEWLKTFSRVTFNIKRLKHSLDYPSTNCKQAIQGIIKKNLSKADLMKGGTFTPWKDAGQKLSEDYHRKWQFQYEAVDSSLGGKALKLSPTINDGEFQFTVADELYAALGTFGLYAAIAEIKITPKGTRFFVDVTKVIIYARDTYDYLGPQYLGHWNEDGLRVIVTDFFDKNPTYHVPAEYLEAKRRQDQLDAFIEKETAELGNLLRKAQTDPIFLKQLEDKGQQINKARQIRKESETFQVPLDELDALYIKDFDGTAPKPENRWFYVHNKHYREWRVRQGGKAGHDMMILSDAEEFDLERWIIVEGEI
jgi:hypothetical protein